MRKCVVCGARVRNLNQKVDTCSATCTRVKRGEKMEDITRRAGDINSFELEKSDREHAYRTREWTIQEIVEHGHEDIQD